MVALSRDAPSIKSPGGNQETSQVGNTGKNDCRLKQFTPFKHSIMWIASCVFRKYFDNVNPLQI